MGVYKCPRCGHWVRTLPASTEPPRCPKCGNPLYYPPDYHGPARC